jgi:hypothetical protein
MNHFDGETYEPQHDSVRLSSQLERVFNAMVDGRWRTLQEIQNATNPMRQGNGIDSLPAISARLRDFRKIKFGNHVVNRRRRGEPCTGLWEYQLLINENS